uniref:Secreted protein n=1 Tax=Globodera rostochiensis TaxID=31243 RepID=A0A914IE20_GLORO
MMICVWCVMFGELILRHGVLDENVSIPDVQDKRVFCLPACNFSRSQVPSGEVFCAPVAESVSRIVSSTMIGQPATTLEAMLCLLLLLL